MVRIEYRKRSSFVKKDKKGLPLLKALGVPSHLRGVADRGSIYIHEHRPSLLGVREVIEDLKKRNKEVKRLVESQELDNLDAGPSQATAQATAVTAYTRPLNTCSQFTLFGFRSPFE